MGRSVVVETSSALSLVIQLWKWTPFRHPQESSAWQCV